MTAQAQFEADLKAQGLGAEAFTTAAGQPFILLRDFLVTSGRFEGRVLELGLEVPPNYPQSLGSAIHVRVEPRLLPAGQQSNGYNILDNSSALGMDWQYWSFNLSDIWQGGRGPSLSSLINGVMHRA